MRCCLEQTPIHRPGENHETAIRIFLSEQTVVTEACATQIGTMRFRSEAALACRSKRQCDENSGTWVAVLVHIMMTGNSPHTDTAAPTISASADLICLSHLRWNFVFQRPQHLISRYATSRRVFFVEEPIFHEHLKAATVTMEPHGHLLVVTPQLPTSFNPTQVLAAQRSLLSQLIAAENMQRYVLWYYTPQALRFSDHLKPDVVVYDCMDELSAFKNADPALPRLERELMQRADLVFTGGQSLFEAKQHQHHNIHALPSSVDVEHFAAARRCTDEPTDQVAIPHPRLGFFGVLDERLDVSLLRGVAEARPDWQLVMIGPVVKIDPAELPQLPNIHYLGPKKYEELPRYIAGWDVALLLFARNDATKYISPTKTPEYLAAGKPVVSTSIRDVVAPYGDMGLVRIADAVPDFVAACGAALTEAPGPRRVKADAFLRNMSWDRTWGKTAILLKAVFDRDDRETQAVPVSVNKSTGVSLGA
jgi:UDP-galactopyranose mutase